MKHSIMGNYHKIDRYSVNINASMRMLTCKQYYLVTVIIYYKLLVGQVNNANMSRILSEDIIDGHLHITVHNKDTMVTLRYLNPMESNNIAIVCMLFVIYHLSGKINMIYRSCPQMHILNKSFF